MHEASLVRSLLHQVEQVAQEHDGTSVTQVEVEIGPLSGVEPLLVREAFHQQVDGTFCSGAELVIQEVVLRACCRDCRAAFAIEDFRFHCPDCGSPSVHIIQGDEFRLLSVSVQQSQPMESTP